MNETVQQIQVSLRTIFEQLDAYFMLPNEVRAYHYSAQEWSINEILEHITLTNHYLMLVIRVGVAKALKRASNQPFFDTVTALEPIERIGDPDAFAWIRPIHMQPTGQISSAGVRSKMQAQATECLQFLRQMPNGEGALHKVSMSVQDLGKLDMYQWIYFLVQHAKRHTVEIERIIDYYAK